MPLNSYHLGGKILDAQFPLGLTPRRRFLTPREDQTLPDTLHDCRWQGHQVTPYNNCRVLHICEYVMFFKRQNLKVSRCCISHSCLPRSYAVRLPGACVPTGRGGTANAGMFICLWITCSGMDQFRIKPLIVNPCDDPHVPAPRCCTVASP